MKCRRFPILILVLTTPLLLGGAGNARVRLPAGEGLLYPRDPEVLRTAIQQYLNDVEPITLPGPVVGCIVPHSNLRTCGPVMASAIKPLQRGQYDRVVLLSPALLSQFRGCSVPSVQYYRTPLGDIELDGPAIRRITLSSVIQTRAVIYRISPYADPEVNRTPLHEREFAQEIVLPFLQVQLGTFKLVPIVVGSLDLNLHQVDTESGPRIDDNAVETVTRALLPLVDERTLIVVCSEFTRYGAVHDFTPFYKNILQGIAELDLRAFKIVEKRQYNTFKAYLTETGNPISGKMPILISMGLWPRAVTGILLGYDVSARITGSPDTSVSYAAIDFVDGTRPLPEPISSTPAEELPIPGQVPAGVAKEDSDVGSQ